MNFSRFSVADDEPAEVTPRGKIVDSNGEPVHGVQVTLHRWDGKLSPAVLTAKSDEDGNYQFPTQKNDCYYCVVMRKSGYALLEQNVVPDQAVNVTLHKPIDCWIDVKNAKGEPLPDAQVTVLEIQSPSNSSMHVSQGMEKPMGVELKTSDSAGRLPLPPLPEGSTIIIKIEHPQWAAQVLKNVSVKPGRIGEVTLPEGVITTFPLVIDHRTPMSLDDLTYRLNLFSDSSASTASIRRLAFAIEKNQFQVCAYPTTYRSFQLTADGVAITPHYDYSNPLTIKADEKPRFPLLVRKTFKAAGRVVHSDGSPHPGARVYVEIENLSADGAVVEANRIAYMSFQESDRDGRYTVEVPPGRDKIWISAEGYTSEQDAIEVNVHLDQPIALPDFILNKLQPIRGRIVDESQHPVPGALIRLRHLFLPAETVTSNVNGQFEIEVTRVPLDFESKQRDYDIDVIAFVADRPLIGITHLDLRQTERLQDLTIQLQREDSPDAILQAKDNRQLSERLKKFAAVDDKEKFPEGERGQPAPELDGVAWLNADARSLEDFRGRYVLLDFWFIGCGPCHEEFPTVKKIHEHFEKLGVTVIGVHNNSASLEAVKAHCEKIGLTFPIVVDHPDGRISAAYQKLGLTGYPTYYLIGPDGMILENDSLRDHTSLRRFKLEVVRKYVLHSGK